MKKREIILIFSLITLFLILSFARAQNDVPSLPGGITTGQIENASNQVANLTGQFGQPNQYWTYIGNEIQKIVFGSPVFKAVDSFLHKISFVFFVLFGVQYSFSFSLLLIIGLWFYFFLTFNKIFRNFASFSKWVSTIISLLMVIIMAQVKAFEWLVNLAMFILFGDKPWWLKLIITVVTIAVLVLVFWFVGKFGKQIKENRKKMKEEENRFKLAIGAKSAESFTEATGRIFKGVK